MSSENRPRKCVWLTFSYEGDRIELVSQEPVETIIPPAAEAADAGTGEDAGEFFYQLESADGAPLLRVPADDPVRRYYEVFSPEAAESSISRVPVEDASGVFSVVVPELEAADRVTLFSSRAQFGPDADVASAASSASEARPARPVATFRLARR